MHSIYYIELSSKFCYNLMNSWVIIQFHRQIYSVYCICAQIMCILHVSRSVLSGGVDNNSEAVTTVAVGAAKFDDVLCLEFKE